LLTDTNLPRWKFCFLNFAGALRDIQKGDKRFPLFGLVWAKHHDLDVDLNLDIEKQ